MTDNPTVHEQDGYRWINRCPRPGCGKETRLEDDSLWYCEDGHHADMPNAETVDNPYLQPGQSKTWSNGVTVTCEILNASLAGFYDGAPVYSTVVDGVWDAWWRGQSATAALPQGVHKGAGWNVSPAGEVLVTVANSTAPAAIPGKGAANDVWLLDLQTPANSRKILSGFGATKDVLARIWPAGIVGADGHFEDLVIGELWRVRDPEGLIRQPFGDWYARGYALAGGMPFVQWGGQGLWEPYGTTQDDTGVLLATDFDASNWLGARIHVASLAAPGPTAPVLFPSSTGYQEFCAQLADSSYIFNWANESLGLEVWHQPLGGTALNRLTFFWPPALQGCTQLVPDPADAKRFWVSVIEGGPMDLNCYEIVLP